MRSGTLLRIGIHLLGVYALLMSATNGVYYLITFFEAYDSDAGFFVQAMTPHLLAYFVLPLAFAFWALGFAGRTTRALIGRLADDLIAQPSLSDRALFVTAIQVLGVYLVVHHGASVASYFFEAFIHKARDSHQEDPRVLAEAVYSGLGLTAGLVFSLRPKLIETKIRNIEPGATDNPDPAP